MGTITVRLDRKLDSELKKLAKRTGRPKSELIRDALRRQLALARFEDLRASVAPFAEARGWLTDEDVFRDVS
jgi:predicted transcriptional regulator